MKSYSFNCKILFALLSVLHAKNVQTNAIEGRIISGIPATAGEFPWQVLIKEDEYDNLKCGGSIISENFVLTAAHCTFPYLSVLLVFGTIELNNDSNNMTATEIFIHPKYIHGHVNNDVSIIKVPTPFKFTSNIQPISLVRSWEAQTSFIGEVATITGFGLTDDEYLDPSPVLLWANVKMIDLNACRAVFVKENISDTNMCARGARNTNMATCSGDSGGALIKEINGRTVQMGINSFVARDECTYGYPSGYVEVSSFLNYISYVTNLPFN